MKTRVAHFWLQKTKSFPDGAPQREEYDSDSSHDVACMRYDMEWCQEYECGDKDCTNQDCPQHGRKVR